MREAKAEHAEAVAAVKVDPYGFGALLASFREPPETDPELDALLDTLDGAIPANDNDDALLDDMLAGLPVDFGDVLPAPVVTNLDGTPAEIEPALEPSAPAVRGLVTQPTPSIRRLKPRSGLRAKEDARRMRASAGTSAGGSRRTPPTLSPASQTPSTPKTSTSTKAKTTITTGPTYRRGIASWKDAGELPKIISINRALSEFGTPFAFSLNVDPKLLKAGNDNVRGLLDYLRRRVALELKRAIGRTPAMWLVVETDEDGRPHLHGGIAMNDNDRPDVIEKALAKAGGNWTRQGSAPADVRAQWNADGWGAYPLKRIERTRQHLREAAGLAPGARVTVYGVTNDLRAAGERIHAEERRRIGRK